MRSGSARAMRPALSERKEVSLTVRSSARGMPRLVESSTMLMANHGESAAGEEMARARARGMMARRGWGWDVRA
jgi:hypothetical protein